MQIVLLRLLQEVSLVPTSMLLQILVFFQERNAVDAAEIAFSKSPLDASGTCVNTIPSAGLITPAVFPPSALLNEF